MKLKKQGFTLLELLVVIGIIALLVAIGTVSYTSAQQRTRNAKRRGDVKAIQAAMEQAYAASATYVYPACPGAVSSCAAISAYFANSAIPADPGTGTYTFVTSTTTAYQVCATLETNPVTTFCSTQLQ